MNELQELYREVILDHNRNPRNYPRKPEGTNRTAHGFNPLCGDEFHLHLRVEDGVIRDVGFEGAGCAISTASASLMTEALKGKSEEDARRLFASVRGLLMDAPASGEDTERLGKLEVLSGVKEFPMRVKCATLAWHTMQAALKNEDEMVMTE